MKLITQQARTGIPSIAFRIGIRYFQSSSHCCETIKPHDLITDESDVSKVNQEYLGRLEIKDTKYGRGLFALRDYTYGEHVMTGRALDVTSNRCSHSVQTDWDKHALMNFPAVMINHSCDANVGIQDNSEGAYDYIALNIIASGEELLWDYETSEFEIENFTCFCGTPICRRKLRGFRYHGEAVRKNYGEDFIAGYLKTN